MLSPKQLSVVQHSITDKYLCLSGGATRSGKSHGTNYSFGVYVENNLEFDHAIVGYTLESLVRNVIPGIVEYFQGRGFAVNVTTRFGTRIEVTYGTNKVCRIWLCGANDARAHKRIQGATLKGALVDESVNIPQDLWQMLQSRMTFADSKVWATYNPDHPNHWFKEDVEDRISEYNGVHYKFNFDDNPTLSQTVKDRLNQALTGVWRKRLVEGEWTGATGLVYTYYNTELHKLDMPQKHFSVDWGVATVFAALRMDIQGDKGNVVSELVYDARNDVPRTDTQHAQAFNEWANAPGATVIVDPTTSASFKRLLRNMGYRVRNANNEVYEGLRHTSEKLALDDIRISKNCDKLIKELNGYSWSDTDAEKDKDSPIKKNDHLCDCLRYATHTLFHDWGDMILPVRKALYE